MMRQGAYRPMPSVISAPRRKLIAMPSWSFVPVSASAVPAGTARPSADITISPAATSSAAPIPTWMFRRGQPGNYRCPKPRADNRRQDQQRTRVRKSTSTMVT